jgi:hypothetical protein
MSALKAAGEITKLMIYPYSPGTRESLLPNVATGILRFG